MADKPHVITADEVHIVKPGDPMPVIQVIMPDGSVVHADELPRFPPPGLSGDELELWLENEEDERLFGENI